LPLQPKTPPTAILTDEDRRTISIPVNTDLTIQIRDIVSQLLSVCKFLVKQGVLLIKQIALTAITKRATLRSLNQGLVEKTTRQRRKNSGKHCREARILTVKEIQTKAEEREVREAVEAVEKARKGRYRARWALQS
jgi:hypothetical protein